MVRGSFIMADRDGARGASSGFWSSSRTVETVSGENGADLVNSEGRNSLVRLVVVLMIGFLPRTMILILIGWWFETGMPVLTLIGRLSPSLSQVFRGACLDGPPEADVSPLTDETCLGVTGVMGRRCGSLAKVLGEVSSDGPTSTLGPDSSRGGRACWSSELLLGGAAANWESIVGHN